MAVAVAVEHDGRRLLEDVQYHSDSAEHLSRPRLSRSWQEHDGRSDSSLSYYDE